MIGAQDALQPSRSPTGDPVGTVIICSREGNILKVIRDDLGLIQGEDLSGLSGMVDRDSRKKLENYLIETDRQGYAFNKPGVGTEFQIDMPGSDR